MKCESPFSAPGLTPAAPRCVVADSAAQGAGPIGGNKGSLGTLPTAVCGRQGIALDARGNLDIADYGKGKALIERRYLLIRLLGTNLGQLGINQLRRAAKARHDFLPDRCTNRTSRNRSFRVLDRQ